MKCKDVAYILTALTNSTNLLYATKRAHYYY